ncbi:MAG: hypothetical protein Q8N84_00680 [bacterium]|nr:hypothetical protein [bacterium]
MTSKSSSILAASAPRRGGFGATLIKTILVLILVAAIGGGIYLGWKMLRPNGVDSSKYQAVFLSNSQVYFGRLKGYGSSHPVLENVYYLVATKPLQSQEGEKPVQPQYTLVKLGGELHGPESKLILSSEHILFVENLKDDGRVVTTIKKSESAAPAGGQPTGQPTNQPAPAQPKVEETKPAESGTTTNTVVKNTP